MTRVNFLMSLEKGEAAEDIIRKRVEAKGFVVYQPKTEGAHAFDMLAIKDKRSCIALDVKAKTRRTYYADTGINQSHFDVYRAFSERHAMPFWVVFVDEASMSIYGNELEKLETPTTVKGLKYPRIEKGIRYWPLVNMITIGEIKDEESEKLKRLSQRSYSYEIAKAP